MLAFTVSGAQGTMGWRCPGEVTAQQVPGQAGQSERIVAKATPKPEVSPSPKPLLATPQLAPVWQPQPRSCHRGEAEPTLQPAGPFPAWRSLAMSVLLLVSNGLVPMRVPRV